MYFGELQYIKSFFSMVISFETLHYYLYLSSCTEERTWTPISSLNAGVLNLNYSRVLNRANFLIETSHGFFVAEDGIEPPTSRLWALRAAPALLRNVAGAIGFAPILLPPMGGGS